MNASKLLLILVAAATTAHAETTYLSGDADIIAIYPEDLQYTATPWMNGTLVSWMDDEPGSYAAMVQEGNESWFLAWQTREAPEGFDDEELRAYVSALLTGEGEALRAFIEAASLEVMGQMPDSYDDQVLRGEVAAVQASVDAIPEPPKPSPHPWWPWILVLALQGYGILERHIQSPRTAPDQKTGQEGGVFVAIDAEEE